MRKWIIFGSFVIVVMLFFTLVDFRVKPMESPLDKSSDQSLADQPSLGVDIDLPTLNPNDFVEPLKDPEVIIYVVPETGSVEQEIEIERLLKERSLGSEIDLELLDSVDTETALKLINIASSLADRFRYEAGIAWADDAIRLDPGLPEAHLMSGYLHFKLLNTERAIAAFEKTIELDPHNFDAYLYLGRIYNGNDNPGLGMDYLTRGIKIANNPRDVSLGFAYRAFSHALLDQYEESLNDLEDALYLDPDNGWAVFFQGKIMEEIKLREMGALESQGIPGQSIGVTP